MSHGAPVPDAPTGPASEGSVVGTPSPQPTRSAATSQITDIERQSARNRLRRLGVHR